MTRDELTATLSEYAGATPDEQTAIAEKILAENDRIIAECDQRQADFDAATEQYRQLRKKYVQGVLNSVPVEQGQDIPASNPETGDVKTTFESLFSPVKKE